jgi:hypothetical protein
MATVGALLMVALDATLGATPAGAQAPSAPAEIVPLAVAMGGDGLDVVATATSRFVDDTAIVAVRVHNDRAVPVQIDVPYGAMFAPEVESQQTVVTAGPIDASLASTTFEAPPGASTHEFVAFCGERLDHSPAEAVPVSYRGVAAEPLPTVLGNIARQHPAPKAAQEAVWWVTDQPAVPVPAAVAPLLEGVDTAAFSAAPQRVVPGPGYTPMWAGGAPATGGPPGSGGATSLAPVGLVAVLTAVAGGLTYLLGRRRPTPHAAVVRPVPAPPGWYPDPSAPGGGRWWDGQRWVSSAG